MRRPETRDASETEDLRGAATTQGCECETATDQHAPGARLRRADSVQVSIDRHSIVRLEVGAAQEHTVDQGPAAVVVGEVAGAHRRRSRRAGEELRSAESERVIDTIENYVEHAELRDVREVNLSNARCQPSVGAAQCV